MSNIFTMYKIEIKKILSKKSIWIALLIGIIFVLLVGLTNLSADGHIEYVKYQKDVLVKISGEKIDEKFFEKFHNEINQEIKNNWDLYEKLNEYDPGAAYLNVATAIGKRAVYDFIFNVVRDREKMININSDDFYKMMKNNIIFDGKELGSSQAEIDNWLNEFDTIEKPIKYSYSQGFQNIVDVLFLISWILFINIAVALSGVFANEKTNKTDAIILSCKNGRIPICVAKILAGISVSIIQTIILLGSCFLIMFSFFGFYGWNAQIQNVLPSSPWNITLGQMTIIYILLAIVTSCFFALTNMFLSHITRSAVATMAIHTGFLFAGLFNIPGKLGLISKLWQLKPTMALYYGTFCNTFKYLGLNNVEISFAIYIIFIIILTICLIYSYKKSQIESR